MPSFGQDFLKGFIGNDTLRDYTHASRVFTTNQYELKPRYKFLFHVSFTINYQQIPYLRGVFPNDEIGQLSLLVKNVDLPKFTVDTETLSQYNRKRVVQTRVNYQPVNVTFHDDGGDNARRLWYYYFSYYYKDPTQQYLVPNILNTSAGASANRQPGFGYNTRDIYAKDMQVKDWGYNGETWNDGTSTASGKPPFFRDIRIYGLDQHKFAEYVLINPVITSWNHDRYDYAEGNGVMEHQMTLAYETVKYYDGAIGNARPDNNTGFADPAHYDTRVSPLARPGANATVFGQGGLLDAGVGILNDLDGTPGGFLRAIQTGTRAYDTFKGANLRSIVRSEATALGTEAILGGAAGATRAVISRPTGVNFPT